MTPTTRSIARAAASSAARIDVLSELDVIWRTDFGFRISGAGWYDAAYENSDNPKKGSLPNGLPYDYHLGRAQRTSPVNTPTDAEDLHYAGGELLDAFVFGNWYMGDTALGVRAGRHTSTGARACWRTAPSPVSPAP